MKTSEVLQQLESLADAGHREHMEKVGIRVIKAHGVSVRKIREMARKIGTNHKLAEELWKSDIHEARTLATLIADPKRMSRPALDRWVKSIHSWDICDSACGNLFNKTPFAYEKARKWVKSDSEYIRRAGFVMMANLAVHDKGAAVKDFEPFFRLIKRYSDDERNFVKKAATWALRQIGKRSQTLCRHAIEVGEQLLRSESGAQRWVARDALRELRSDKVQSRLFHKSGRTSGRSTRAKSKR